MRDLYFRCLSRLLAHSYYHRIRLLQPENRPASGPVLYVGLHRNGAVDGCVYKSLLPSALFMISVQLRRNLLGRIFFHGIEVVREQDGGGDRNTNADALDQCVDVLKRDGVLFLMPEGSSNLGHRHLPFRKGVARILAAALEAGLRPTVVPVGIHYERAWAWQSDVEVVLGPPLPLDLPPGSSGPAAVDLLHRRISAGLETLAVAAPDAESFARRERAALVATLSSGRSYFAALKAMEAGVPEAETALADFEKFAADQQLFKYQGVPLLPARHAWADVVHALVLAPLVSAAGLLNLPPLLIAWGAGRRFADARNTIALWRLLAGFPAFLTWTAGLLALAIMTGHWPLWTVYVALSWLGLRSLGRLKKLAVGLGNLWRVPDLRPRLLALHRQIAAALSARGL